MLIKISISLLITAGFFIIFGVNPISALPRLLRWKPKLAGKKQTAAAFVRMLDGKKKENLVTRSLNDTRKSLTIIGQSQKYKRTVRLSILTGAAVAACAFWFFSSPLLMIVLGIGCGLVPLWATNLSVYTHTRMVNDELETALSMITTSYTRHSDIVKAVEETLTHSADPVRPVLARFVNTVKFIDSNIESAIVCMKQDLDNTLFHEWCDILLLCQSDHTLKAGLQPAVNKISKLKAQQNKNETQMMMPMRDAVKMVGLACCPIPLLMLINQDWYYYLVHTLAGQITMTVVAVIIFASINKAIKLSKPLDYRI